MYLQKLFKHSKIWFLFVIAFITGQAIVIYKFGFVVSPFYDYGMYSAPIYKKDTVQFFEITVNNQKILPTNYTAQTCDKLFFTLNTYNNIVQKNSFEYYSAVQPFFSKYNLNADSLNFIFKDDKADFYTWYKKYVSSILNIKVDSLQVHSITALKNKQQIGNILLPLKSETFIP